MDLSLIEKDPAAFAALMMAKPHGSAFTPPIHDDGDSIDGAWCRATDAAVDAPFLIRDAKAAGSFSMRERSIVAALSARVTRCLVRLWLLAGFRAAATSRARPSA